MSEPLIRFDDALKYDRFMGIWSQIVADDFIKWLAPKPKESWVDVGCGSGAFSRKIMSSWAPETISGIDPSASQIEFAKSLNLGPNIRFEVGDAQNLPYPDKTFDNAVMALVLFFVSEPARGLAEMLRVVRPFGTVAAYVWDIFGEGLPLNLIHSEMRKRDISYPIPPSAEVSRIPALCALWSQAGLSDVKTNIIAVQRRYDSFQDFWDINTGSPALSETIQKLAPKQLADIRQAVKKKVAIDASGALAVSAHVNAIKGIAV